MSIEYFIMIVSSVAWQQFLNPILGHTTHIRCLPDTGQALFLVGDSSSGNKNYKGNKEKQ